MQKDIKIDAVAILYNPGADVIENIRTYINNVHRLFVVDNSDIINNSIVEKLREFDNLIYINNNGNKGIAYALNLGAELAIKESADWLLTMDQDSRFEENSLEKMIDWIKNNNITDIGIFSPYHLMDNNYESYVKEDIVIDTVSVMTSGNLLNLVAFKKTGKFNEKYFIDYVDHEYCFRLQKNGFYIKVFKGSVLLHKLGDMQMREFLGSTVCFTNHNYIRRYYMTRNRLDLAYNYLFSFPEFILQDFHRFFIEWKNILLFEENKIKKQKSIILGIIHFLIGKYGKYDF